jgi:hypothetical protein
MPQLQLAADKLLRSKMFYVPFLICKRPGRLRASPNRGLGGERRRNNAQVFLNAVRKFFVKKICHFLKIFWILKIFRII